MGSVEGCRGGGGQAGTRFPRPELRGFLWGQSRGWAPARRVGRADQWNWGSLRPCPARRSLWLQKEDLEIAGLSTGFYLILGSRKMKAYIQSRAVMAPAPPFQHLALD